MLRLVSLDATELAELLESDPAGAQLLELTGAPLCGIDIYYYHYWTVGGAHEIANASAALMLPTGGTSCTGARPILLYAHGTATSRQYNIAAFTDPNNAAHSESALIAAMYAAQGFIVVAPNYAGYDVSDLAYHPYLNARQQAGDMIDALEAARSLLPTAIETPVTDNGKLLLSGYSQGAHVAMATMRALQGANQTVTAIAASSGPYALEWFGDAIMLGNVDFGSIVFAPLLTSSYQMTYGDIYTTPTDVFSAQYATGITHVLPSNQPLLALFAERLLPETALFNSTTPTVDDLTAAGVPSQSAPSIATLMAVPTNNALYASGFGSQYLINNATRIAYVLESLSNEDGAISQSPTAGLAPSVPTNPLRHAFYLNDMRHGGWTPTSPMFLCGGHRDPTVYFQNTTIMQQFWSALPSGTVTVYDTDPGTNTPGDALQAGFALAASALNSSEFVQNYHGALVPPFCARAARDFLLTVLSH
jgi:predicted esterase